MSTSRNVQNNLDNSTRKRVADARAWFAEFHSEGGDGGRSWLSLSGVRGDDEGPDWAELVSCDRIPTDPAELGQFLDGLAESAVQASGEPGTNVFAAVYPFGIAGRQKGGALVRRHVQADIDGPADLGRARMLGALVVASGGTATREDGTEADKTHVYVRVSEPLDEETHRVLCEALGAFVGGRYADTSKTGDDLVLRVPGTLHDKGQPGDPRPVRWITRPDDPSVRTWAPADLARMLGVELGGDRDDEESPGSALEPEGAPGEHPGAAAALEARLARAVAAVSAAPESDGNSCLNWAAGICAGLAAIHPGRIDAEEVQRQLIAAFLARPIPPGESVRSRRREAGSTVASGWRWGSTHPLEATRDRRDRRDRSAADRPVPTEAVQEAAEHHGEAPHVSDAGSASTDEDEGPRIPSSWRPIGLGGLAGLGPLLPSVGADSAGRPMLYPGRTHAVNGPSETFKSWAVLALFAVPELRAGHRVVWIDMEDEARGMALRLAELGVREDVYAESLAYLNPAERMPLGPALDRWGEELAGTGGDGGGPLTLLVVDGLTAFLNLYEGETNSADDLARLIGQFFARLGRRTGAAVVWIDHKAKAAEKGRYALGSVAKMTMVSGAVLDVYRPTGAPRPRIGTTGYLNVRITKDRPGELRARCRDDGDGDDFPVYGCLAVESAGHGFGDVHIDLIGAPFGPSVRSGGADAPDRVTLILDLLRELGAEGRGWTACWQILNAEKDRRSKDRDAEPLPEWMTRTAVREAVGGAKKSGEWGEP